MSVQDTHASTVITPAQLLEHWQGHRRLTRRVIESFSDVQLRNFSVGGMRPFAELAMELVSMAAPTVRGVATGEWVLGDRTVPDTRDELLALWDRATAEIEEAWPGIAPDRFQEVVLAYGQWENQVYQTFLYMIDNEIHHRGQGYVYLRALGITPPEFWQR